jgi:hypothetical protein
VPVAVARARSSRRHQCDSHPIAILGSRRAFLAKEGGTSECTLRRARHDGSVDSRWLP